MAYQMVDSAVETQIQQVALVDEDSQVSLENQRIEIPETGGKKKERQKDKEKQMFSDRERKIQKIKRDRQDLLCYVLFEEMVGDDSFKFKTFNVVKICFQMLL